MHHRPDFFLLDLVVARLASLHPLAAQHALLFDRGNAAMQITERGASCVGPIKVRKTRSRRRKKMAHTDIAARAGEQIQ
jgi:hypothetical protein